MMRKKHALAFGAFASMLLMLGSMPVQAGLDFTTLLTEGENGEARYRNDNLYLSTHIGFLAVTNAEGLSEEAMQQDWIDSCTEWTDKSVRWANGMDAVFAEYGEDVRIYQIVCDFDISVKQHEKLLCRQFMKHKNVLDTMYLDSPDVATVVWDGRFTFDLQYNDADMDAVLEDTMLLDLIQTYTTWTEACEQWYTSVNAAEMSAAELATSRQLAGIPSEYDMTMQAYQTAKEIAAQYPDVIEDISPTLQYRDAANAAYRAVSAWKYVGDINNDVCIDASDAAELLTATTKMGAGGDSGLSELQMENADVNADGIIDASDAAWLLQYAAEAGSGSNVGSLAEFLFSQAR